MHDISGAQAVPFRWDPLVGASMKYVPQGTYGLFLITSTLPRKIPLGVSFEQVSETTV
jgi:hypothetical protein